MSLVLEGVDREAAAHLGVPVMNIPTVEGNAASTGVRVQRQPILLHPLTRDYAQRNTQSTCSSRFCGDRMRWSQFWSTEGWAAQ